MEKERMRWFAGIPVLTNPLILRDVLVLTALAWAGTVAAIVAFQWFFGGSVRPEHFLGAAIYASYLAAMIVGLFVLIGIAFIGKFGALYKLDEDGLYVEQFRGTLERTGTGSGIGYPVRLVGQTHKSSVRVIGWEKIAGCRLLENRNVVLLLGSRGILTKLYCPDRETAQAAAKVIGSRTKTEA